MAAYFYQAQVVFFLIALLWQCRKIDLQINPSTFQEILAGTFFTCFIAALFWYWRLLEKGSLESLLRLHWQILWVVSAFILWEAAMKLPSTWNDLNVSPYLPGAENHEQMPQYQQALATFTATTSTMLVTTAGVIFGLVFAFKP